jgi:hypothetical protein
MEAAAREKSLSIPERGAAGSSKTLVLIYQTAPRHTSEDHNSDINRRTNNKSQCYCTEHER